MAILRGLSAITSISVKLFITINGLILRLKFEQKGLNQMGVPLWDWAFWAAMEFVSRDYHNIINFKSYYHVVKKFKCTQ